MRANGAKRDCKVLYIATAYPRYDGDIITPWLPELIHRLADRGIDIEVLAPSYRGLGTQWVDGVRVHRFRYAPRWWETMTHDRSTPDSLRAQPAYAALLPSYLVAGSSAAIRLARTGRFDLVHAFWPIPHGLFGLAARWAAGVPLVSTFFGLELAWMAAKLPMLRPIARTITRQSDAVTVISSYTASLVHALAPTVPTTTIPFGATVAPNNHMTTERPRTDDAFELLFVGRLIERKGVHVLLDALAKVDSARRIVLHVVGDGDERPRLEALAARLGVAERVRFHGFVPQGELAERFAACDAFVFPARVDANGDADGLGVTLIEALTYGKPVIAGAVGGIVDIVRDGETGLLVPPDDAEAVAAAIQSLAVDPARCRALGRAGRAHVEAEFSWPVIVDRLAAVYHTTLARGARRVSTIVTGTPHPPAP